MKETEASYYAISFGFPLLSLCSIRTGNF